MAITKSIREGQGPRGFHSERVGVAGYGSRWNPNSSFTYDRKLARMLRCMVDSGTITRQFAEALMEKPPSEARKIFRRLKKLRERKIRSAIIRGRMT